MIWDAVKVLAVLTVVSGCAGQSVDSRLNADGSRTVTIVKSCFLFSETEIHEVPKGEIYRLETDRQNGFLNVRIGQK